MSDGRFLTHWRIRLQNPLLKSQQTQQTVSAHADCSFTPVGHWACSSDADIQMQ